MRALKDTTIQLIGIAFLGALFFLVVGPMIGVIVIILSMQISMGNALDGALVIMFFGYYYGAVPATVSGIFFGLTYEGFYQKRIKKYRSLSFLITCVIGIAVAILVYWSKGMFGHSWFLLVSVVAAISAVVCSYFLSGVIEYSRK